VSTHILGISAFYHDSAAALLRDGEIVAAAQEERFTRVKGDASLPVNAIAYCLKEAGIRSADLAYVGFYDKPMLKFKRILQTYLGVAPRGVESFLSALPLWLTNKLFIEGQLRKALGYEGEILYPAHHESHAASAFFPSPFREAAILTIDGVGEWATASWGVGRDGDLQLLHELRWPDSVGLLYSAFTSFTGFKINSGEYKVMGLAPYGEPKYVQAILDELVDLKEDGSFRLNQKYFNYLTGLTMTNAAFYELFGGPPRKPESMLTQREMDLARSVQEVTEEIMLRMVRHVRARTGMKHLCLAGGVALNCVANGRILREGSFDEIWIQPASGDAGGALGAALFGWHQYLEQPRSADGANDFMQGAYLGPAFDKDVIRHALEAEGAVYREVADEQLAAEVAELLAAEHIVGWFQGRMEFGPRALGNRSILADPRSPQMQRQVNLKVKFREGFRPFAPIVLEEKAAEWFDLPVPSPYMLLVAQVHPEKLRQLSAEERGRAGLAKLDVTRSTISAVTHVDGSARIQTVSASTNPLLHRLLTAFDAVTGCPVLVNTSFNVRGEPIVCTPAEALRCFLATDIDALAIGPYLLEKTAQPETLRQRYPRGAMALD
jgi:carbamoyltransferase